MKKWISVLAALLLTFAILTGCQTQDQSQTQDQGTAVSVSESGEYDSREEVAAYLQEYGKLPQNYITKKDAKKLGWKGGSLEPYAPGKSIGGDHFGNREKVLPEEDEYKECDIDTRGAESRGAKRIVYSDDGDIYYTEDHYKTFTKLVEGE
ncbi:ribonuclease [Anaerovorax odorimutans]|uniref:Ribonuclease n=1 Tax=Anaerovorax odorimutans TaxID=109327 RepID=A0ABT1RJ67_9FIRM|nr:ribonuclease domain-containing protein [Anaerovorax odorimutans]MCQ4635228.1 ribonuclease [Anaerovorax odorimutans]